MGRDLAVSHALTLWPTGAFIVSWTESHPENRVLTDTGETDFSSFTSIDWGNYISDAVADCAYTHPSACADARYAFSHARRWHLRDYRHLSHVDPATRPKIRGRLNEL